MKSAPTIKWFKLLDSTNTEAQRHIQLYDNLSVVAAETQTKGRGQRGNTWLSAPGENLTFSVVLKPGELPAKDFMFITFMAASAIRDYLRSEGIPAQIKWPNDIYVGKKKICGMLIENSISGGAISYSIIGVGLNLNQEEFPGDLPNPTSMKLLTGRSFPPKDTLEKLLTYFNFRALAHARESLYEEYLKDLYQAGQPCPYRNLITGEEFTGIIRGVECSGLLNMEMPGGEARLFSFKEVGYIL